MAGRKQRAKPVDLQRPNKPLAEVFGDARQPHPVFLAQPLKAAQMFLGNGRRPLGHGTPPDFGRPLAAAAHQHLVGQRHGPQIPGQAVVIRPQAQEIQERIQHVAAIRLRGDAVVVDVFAVVLHDRFDGDAEPMRGIVQRNGGPQLARAGGIRPPRPGSSARVRRYSATPWCRMPRRFPRFMKRWVNRSPP